jgi:hypothetical protein
MSSTLTNTTYNPSYLTTSLYSTVDSYRQNENGFDDDDEDDFDSLQYQFSSHGQQAFRLFELFIKKLNNPKYLQYILHNWVIGNQLIIKYTNRIDNKESIRALASVFRVCESFYMKLDLKRVLKYLIPSLRDQFFWVHPVNLV